MYQRVGPRNMGTPTSPFIPPNCGLTNHLKTNEFGHLLSMHHMLLWHPTKLQDCIAHCFSTLGPIVLLFLKRFFCNELKELKLIKKLVMSINLHDNYLDVKAWIAIYVIVSYSPK